VVRENLMASNSSPLKSSVTPPVCDLRERIIPLLFMANSSPDAEPVHESSLVLNSPWALQSPSVAMERVKLSPVAVVSCGYAITVNCIVSPLPMVTSLGKEKLITPDENIS